MGIEGDIILIGTWYQIRALKSTSIGDKVFQLTDWTQGNNDAFVVVVKVFPFIE